MSRVSAVNKAWQNEHGKPNSKQLQAIILEGLQDAKGTLTQKQGDIQNQQSRIASKGQSNLSSRVALIDLKLQSIESEEKIRCFDNLAKFTKGNRTLADQNRVNLKNPEFLRSGWENSPGLVHRQRSLEEIKTDWPTQQVRENKAVDEGKKPQPAQLQRQRSLDAHEFQAHMQKVERSEAQQRTESNPQTEPKSSQGQRRFSRSPDSGQPSEPAKNSPLIERLMRSRRSSSVSEVPKPDSSAGSTTKKM